MRMCVIDRSIFKHHFNEFKSCLKSFNGWLSSSSSSSSVSTSVRAGQRAAGLRHGLGRRDIAQSTQPQDGAQTASVRDRGGPAGESQC